MTKTKTETKIVKAEKVVKKPKAKKKVNKKVKLKENEILMVSPINPNSQIIVASELADDAMLEGEIMGTVAEHFIYKFMQEGKEVIGLSVKGVNEVTRRINRDNRSGMKIRINPQYFFIDRDVVYDNVKGVEVRVYAEDMISGSGAWGVKFEPYTKTGRKGSYSNTFAVEKAISKAERNAKRKLIPETMATVMISKLIKENKDTVRTLAPVNNEILVAQPIKSLPSSVSDIENMVLSYIEKANTVAKVIDIDNGTQSSKKFTKEFKALVHTKCNAKADALTNK